MFRNIIMLASLLVYGACCAHAQDTPAFADTTLDSLAAAARVYLKLPERETLPQPELEVLLADYDVLIRSNKIIDRCLALRPFTKGAYLRYDNPEIEERIVELFLSEKDDYARRAEGGATSLADEGIDAPGEVYQDYIDLYEPLAYQTFSPRIYDVALTWYGGGGGLRSVYLACVNPEATLRLLLETHRRQCETLSQGASWLDHPSGLACFGSIEDGLQTLALLCELSPGVVDAERARAVDFVRQHATFYREPIRPRQGREPRRVPVLDLRARDRALRVLELIGGPEEIPLIEDIMRDPPLTRDQVRKGDTVSAVTTRGNALLERLRGTPVK